MENIPGVATGQKNTKSFNVFNIETPEEFTSEDSSGIFDYYDPAIHGTKEEYKEMIQKASQTEGQLAEKTIFEEIPPHSETNF